MAMTPAEKMRAYRQRKKEAGFTQRNVWVQAGERPGKVMADPPPPKPATDGGAESRREKWETELHAEKLKAARAEGRKLARQKDRTAWNGRITGLCEAAAFFVNKGRADIAQSLLDYYTVDREQAEAALQADKRTHSLTLETLDRAGAWETPPPILR